MDDLTGTVSVEPIVHKVIAPHFGAAIGGPTDRRPVSATPFVNMPAVDLAGVRMLAALNAELRAAGIRLRLVAAHATARDILRAEGLEEAVGYLGRTILVADAIDEFQGRPVQGLA